MFELAKLEKNTTLLFMQKISAEGSLLSNINNSKKAFYPHSNDIIVLFSADFIPLQFNPVAEKYFTKNKISDTAFQSLSEIVDVKNINSSLFWVSHNIWVTLLNSNEHQITLMFYPKSEGESNYSDLLQKHVNENNQLIGILCTLDGTIIETTQKAQDYFCSDSECLIGNELETLEQIIDSEISLSNIFQELKTTNKELKFNINIKDSVFETRLLKLTAFKIHSHSEDLICFIGVDESKLNELIQSLNQSKELYNLITQYASDDIILIEKNKVKYVSPQYYSKVSIDLKSIAEFDIYDIMKMLIHPEDIERIANQVYEDEINQVKKTTYSYRLKMKNGEYRWNEDQIYREFDSEGNGLRTVINSRDINSRMEIVKALEASEERFRNIIHLTPNIAIQVFDCSGKIIDWNKASENMYKYSKEEVVGKTFAEVIFKSDAQNQRFLEQLEKIKETGKSFEPREYIVYDKDQKEIYILSTTYPLPSGRESNVHEFICMDVDISELKKTQLELENNKQALITQNERLIQAKEKIEEADRLKMSFLANVSHEIRTPMNAIIGFSQLLLMNDVSEDERFEYADYILKRSNDLLQLINDILDVSRIESGEMPLNPKQFQISNLLSHIFENYSMKMRFAEKNIEIKLDIEGELLEETCYQDEERLKQILINLLENAFKFTEKGHIEIACKKHGNESIDFIVRDTGIGIDEDKINQIFNPFVQADSNHATRKYGGTGLGLSIVKGLSELIQGEIIVESEINKGSVFTIRVPRKLTLLKNE